MSYIASISPNPPMHPSQTEAIVITLTESVSAIFAELWALAPSWLKRGMPPLSQFIYFTITVWINGDQNTNGATYAGDLSSITVAPTDVANAGVWPPSFTLTLSVAGETAYGPDGTYSGISFPSGAAPTPVGSVTYNAIPSQAQCKATQVLIDARSGRPVHF